MLKDPVNFYLEILEMKYAFLSLFVFMTACATPGIEGLRTDLPLPTSITSIEIPEAEVETQTLNKLDIVTVNVFGAPDLSGDYQLDYDGNIKMPLIGIVQTAGLNPQSLARSIEQRYEQSYLQNATVSVLVNPAEVEEEFITVDGSVKSPGQYPVDGRITLMRGIALAGGTSELANPKRVLVFRELNGETHVAGFNLKEIRDGNSPDPTLIVDDVVVVDGDNVTKNYRELSRSFPLINIFRTF